MSTFESKSIFECASRNVKIFADFDSSGRVSVYLSDKNLERQIRYDKWLEADILVAMAKDVPEIRKFLKKLSSDLYLAALENIKRREAKPFDLVPELQNFKNECAKHNISIVAGRLKLNARVQSLSLQVAGLA